MFKRPLSNPVKKTLLILSLAVLAAACRADTVALSFSGGNVAPGFNGVEAGWNFSLTSPVTVTQLGFWDGPSGPNGSIGNGLLSDHPVMIWDSTGTVVVPQATIPFGSGATLVADFRYVSVAPTLLPAGTYTIGAFWFITQPGSFNDPVAESVSSITTASGVTYNGSRSVSGIGIAFPPTDHFNLPNSYFGPNFQFTSTSVPDSGPTLG